VEYLSMNLGVQFFLLGLAGSPGCMLPVMHHAQDSMAQTFCQVTKCSMLYLVAQPLEFTQAPGFKSVSFPTPTSLTMQNNPPKQTMLLFQSMMKRALYVWAMLFRKSETQSKVRSVSIVLQQVLNQQLNH
jgi:hypothetical protein